jgi:hypothetical protein
MHYIQNFGDERIIRIIISNLIISLLITLFIILTNQIVGQLFFNAIKVKNFQKMNLVYGFQIIIIIYSFNYIFGFAPVKTYLYNLLLLTLLIYLVIYQFFFHKNYIRKVYDFRLVSFMILIVVFVISGAIELKFHSSPDNHGLLSTVSYISQKPSLEFLQEDFMVQSGSQIPAHLGQKTTVMDSTWNILDARLRFTADTILTVGRIGLPVYLSSFISSSYFQHVTYLILILGVYISWLTWNCLLGMSESLEHRTKRNNLYLIFLTLTPLNIVWIVEGTVNQLSLLLAIATMVNIQYKTNLGKNTLPKYGLYAVYIIPILFLTVTYPQGLPFLLIVTILFQFSLPKEKNSHKSIQNILMASFSASFILIATVRHTLFPIILNFNSGISGHPYQIGSLGLIKSTFWLPEGLKFTTATSTDDGFGEISINYSNIVIQVLILNFLTILLVLIAKDIKKYNKVASIALILVVTILVFRTIFSKYNDNTYVYIRYLVLYILVISIILIVRSNSKKFNVGKNLERGYSLTILIMTILQIYSARNSLVDFSTQSNKIIENTVNINREIFNSESIFLSEEPMHKYFSLTLLGEFNYLTDNWGPQISVIGKSKEFEVYMIRDAGERIKIENLGNFIFDQTIKGPKTLSEIEQYRVTKN